MKKPLFLFLALLVLSGTASAQQVDEGGPADAVAPQPAAGEAVDASGVGNENVTSDYFTGAATYRVPIELPEGRQQMTPRLALVYNSHRHREDGHTGKGWDLTVSHIARMHKYGTPDYDGGEFVLHEEGEDVQLIRLEESVNDCQLYRFKVEGTDQRRFFRCDGYWEMYDKKGVRHYFGLGESKLQSGRNVYRWYLSKSEDLNGNAVLYRYEPENWRYEGETMTYLRLRSVEYTRFGGNEDGLYRVELGYTPREHNRFQFRPAFGLLYGSLLTEIRVLFQDGSPIRRYQLDYTGTNGASYLSQVAQSAGSEQDAREEYALQTLPPINFEYGDEGIERLWRGRAYRFADPFGEALRLNGEYHLLDMNGDGRLDRVWAGTPRDELRNDIRVHYGTGFGFSADATEWNDICNGYCFPNHLHFLDMNGDGLPDRILAANGMIYIRYNNGRRFRWGENIRDPFCAGDSPHPEACDQFQMLDMNGDGLPDRVDYDPTRLRTFVYINHGHRFSTVPEVWEIRRAEVEDGHLRRLIDMNGDNLPDLVVPSSAFRNMAGGFLAIYWNHGHGWSGLPVWWQDPGIDAELNNPHFSWLTDVNNDRLPDRVLGGGLSGAVGFMKIHLNNGTGLDPDGIRLRDPSSWNNWGFLRYDNGGQLVPGILDLNGDGTPERVTVSGDDYIVYATSFRIPNRNYDQPPGLLSRIDNGMGVRRQLGYTSTLEIQNRLMPFHLYCLGSVRLQEGEESQDTYLDYAGGQFYSDWYNVVGRKFNGFQFVRIRDPLNGVEERWYTQAKDVIGGNLFVAEEHIPPLGDGTPIPVRPVETDYNPQEADYWEDIRQSGRLAKRVVLVRKPGRNSLEKFSMMENQWNLNGRFIYLSSSTESVFEGQPQAVEKTTRYVYAIDSGNVTRITESVSAGNPGTKITEYAWPNFRTAYGDLPSGFPARIQKKDAAGNIQSHFDFDYDDHLRLIRQVERVRYAGQPDFSRATLFSDYDRYGNPGKIRYPNGLEAKLQYDGRAHAYPVRVALNDYLVTVQDADLRFGKTTLEVSPAERRTVYRYDALGRPIEKQFQGQWRERYAYFDRVPRGDGARLLSLVHKFTYLESDPMAAQLPREVSARDGQGRLIQRGVRSEKSDNSYRMERIRHQRDISRNSRLTSEPFFSDGPTFVENGGIRSVEVRGDSLGRLHRLIPPPGDADSPTGPTETVHGFDGDPLVTTVTDPTGRTTRSYGDLWGNIIRVDELTAGPLQTTRYDHDFFGKLRRIRPALGEEILFEHDSAGRLRQMTDPGMGERKTDYDVMDNPVRLLDAMGNVLNSVYDPYGRMVEQKVHLPDGNEEGKIRYYYDTADTPGFSVRKGEIFRIADTKSRTRFSYDRNGNMEKTERLVLGSEREWTTTYAHAGDDRLESLKFPSGLLQLRYAYDRSGKIGSITNGATREAYYEVNPDNGYDVFGNLLRESLGNGTENRYARYPNSHRLMEMETTPYRRLRYTYDAAVNVTGVRDLRNPAGSNAGFSAIRYDSLHRILGYDNANNWESRDRTDYRYDAIGNLLQNDESHAGAGYVNVGQQVQEIGEERFEYDANGSMISGRGRAFSYNGRDQLKELRLQNGERMEYFYDYNGRRLAKTVYRAQRPPEKSFFLGPHFEIRNNLWIHHIYAGDRRIAVMALEAPEEAPPAVGGGGFVFRDDVEEDWPAAGEGYFYYLHPDHLGSSNLFTEGEARATHGGLRYRRGDLVQRIEHNPYGRERLVHHPALDELPRYTGQTYDVESDLYYYQSRYYDPVLGRFIQPDTIIPDPYNPQTLNRYAYALNNPLKYTDPSGHNPLVILGAVALVKAAAMGTAYVGARIALAGAEIAEPSAADLRPGVDRAFTAIGAVNAAEVAVLGGILYGPSAGRAVFSAGRAVSRLGLEFAQRAGVYQYTHEKTFTVIKAIAEFGIGAFGPKTGLPPDSGWKFSGSVAREMNRTYGFNEDFSKALKDFSRDVQDLTIVRESMEFVEKIGRENNSTDGDTISSGSREHSRGEVPSWAD